VEIHGGARARSLSALRERTLITVDYVDDFPVICLRRTTTQIIPRVNETPLSGLESWPIEPDTVTTKLLSYSER